MKVKKYINVVMTDKYTRATLLSALAFLVFVGQVIAFLVWTASKS